MMGAVACPDPALLEALATGSVAGADRIALDEHLDVCADCSQTVAQLARIYGDSIAPGAALAASGDGDSVQPPPLLESETSVGRYRLGRRLGAGGMGVVFEAYDPELDRLVAIKLLHGASSASAVRARLLREARAMARLAHPNVVAVFDIGTHGEQVFIAMELVEGTTLTRWVAQEKRSLVELVRVFTEAGRGLAAAHEVDIVHRDFKPDNVLIGADSRPRVTDFGLARPEDAPPPSTRSPAAPPLARAVGMSLTRTAPGAIVGTPAYMAPEQLRAEDADAKSDQFAFCVAFFEALVGRRPFDGASFDELAKNVLAGRRLATPSSLPRWLRQVIDRGLSTDPAARYPSMKALLAELERDRTRLRRVLLTGLAMAAGAAATVGGLYWYTSVTSAEMSAAPTEPASAIAVDAPAACAERHLVEERWTEARKKQFRASAIQRGISDATATTAIETAMNGWTAAWSDTHLRLCAAAAPHLREKQRTCLARRFRAFEAIAAYVTQNADGYAIEETLDALARLGSPASCANEARAAVQPVYPSDVDQRAAATLVEADLTALAAKLALGQTAYATGPAAELVARAKALGHVPLYAEALLLEGRILHAVARPDEAATELEAAVAQARVAQHDEALTEAALSLVDVEIERVRPKAAEPWLRIAAADAARFDDGALEARVQLATARLRRAEGSFADAVAPMDKALEERRSLHGDAHLLVAEVHSAYADLLVDLDDHAGAVRHARAALDIAKGLTGDHSLPVAAARAALGRALLAQGNPQAALQEFRLAEGDQLMGAKQYHRDERSRAWDGIALAKLALGDLDAAKEAVAKTELARRETWRRAISLVLDGEIAMKTGEHATGLSRLLEALAHLEQHFGKDDLRLVATLRAVGSAELTLNKLADARKTLERALAIVKAELGYEPLQGFVLEDLAEVEGLAGRRKEQLKHLDDAHLLISAAFGHDSARLAANVLQRADLAFELGQKDYAGRLYRGVQQRLAELHGEEHPDTRRANERAAPPEPPSGPPPQPVRAQDFRKDLNDRIRQLQR